jgi:hypothetical protein
MLSRVNSSCLWLSQSDNYYIGISFRICVLSLVKSHTASDHHKGFDAQESGELLHLCFNRSIDTCAQFNRYRMKQFNAVFIRTDRPSVRQTVRRTRASVCINSARQTRIQETLYICTDSSAAVNETVAWETVSFSMTNQF